MHLAIKKYLNNWFLIGQLIMLTAPNFAQQYNFKNYSVENGLPYVQIFTLFQDHNGYLWSGGYGGASKFNGKTFKNYSPKNGLANHYVNTVVEDRNHNMIFGTIDGLSIINKNKITNYTVKNGLPSNVINCLAIDEKGIIWIGTEKGLCAFNGQVFKKSPELGVQSIKCLLNCKDDGLYVGTSKNLYKKHTTDSYQLIIDSLNVNCISKNEANQELYIGTTNGLYAYDLKLNKQTIFHVNNGLLDEDVTAVLCQKNGTTWVGFKNGLLNFNKKEFSYYNISLDNNSNHIRSLMIDDEENLWIGTHNGLYKYRDKGFTVYDRQHGLGSAFIYQIIGDNKNNLWIATENNGVFYFSNGFFKNYSVKEGLLDNSVYSILPFDDGAVWFGNAKGISVFKNDKVYNLSSKTKFNLSGPINCMYKDSKYTIWIGGQNGICSMKQNGNKYLITNYDLPVQTADKSGFAVWSIIEDDSGAIWAGTYLAGIFKLVKDKFKLQTISTAKPIYTALDFCKDNHGNLYAATLDGVLMFNPNKHTYKLISEKEGLSSELVYAVAITKNNNYLWAGTNQGVNRIDVNKLQYNIVDAAKYGKADGFMGVESNSHGIYEDNNNSIWFGTVNGLIKYDPNEFTKNEIPSKTIISNIKIDYKDTMLADGAKLPYSLNNINFFFDGISLTNPEKVLYSYKLEGRDKSWSPNTEINNAKFDNLSPGKYTFKVKSCNNEGIWNIEPTTFSFTIKTPFYKTWLFYLTCLSIIIAVFIGVFKYRVNKLKQKQQLEFEHLKEVSKAELTALKAQMNPHFVFNALNSIQHYILNSKGDEAVKYLSKFAKLIRIILNSTEKTITTINEELESIKLYLELEQMRFENKFNYSINVDESIDGDYDEIPPMLIQPYLENAILHGINPKLGMGNICITIKVVNQFIKISIADDGIGREKSSTSKNLQPAARHKSLGMKITKDRVRILNTIYQSNLNVTIIDLYDKNKEAIGTQVDLFIPYIK
jgi:ligand-binding sensor domain-containing protein